MVGGNFKNETEVKIMGSGFKLAIDETVSTTHGGEFEDAETQSHSKGFVLSESTYDYLSVDVMYEGKDWVYENSVTENGLIPQINEYYPTFIFRTQAGATSCPYEGENITQYYEPGKYVIDQATKQIEVPEIAVEDDFIENVPTVSMHILRFISEITRKPIWEVLSI